MTPERWHQITEVFHSVCACDPTKRDAALSETCGDDVDLRREVELLLAHDATGVLNGLMSRVAASLFNDSAATESKGGASLAVTTRDALDDFLLTGLLDGSPLLDQRYELRRRLGGGGMGVVYLAHHRALHRDVALKVIKPTRRADEFAARFRTEAAALGALKHPHIVDVADYGVDPRNGGIPYLVMELLSGSTLAERLRAGPLTVGDALPILTAIASAIDFAHEHGVLHRDIKPANIYLAQHDAGRQTVKVLDFGVARISADAACSDQTLEASPRSCGALVPAAARTPSTGDTTTLGGGPELNSAAARTVNVSVTSPGEIIGTLGYLAPELVNGERASRASDLYAFGVLAYESLTGKRPFAFSSIEAARRHPYESAAPASTINSALDPEISRVLAWPLGSDPKTRPRTAGEFVDALRGAHHHFRVREWKRTEFPLRRRLSAAIAALLCSVAWLASDTSVSRALERRVLDAQFHFAPTSAPDSRLMVVIVDDRSLAQNPTLGERADEFADRVEQIFAAGASGVALDFLLPRRWSSSSRFSRLVLRHADHLALSVMSAANGLVIGPECVSGLTAAALGPQRTSALFGFVNVEPDSDGVTRRGRLFFRDVTRSLRDSFSTRSIRAGLGDDPISRAGGRQTAQDDHDGFLIDASVDPARLATLSWSSVPDALIRNPALFRGRLVLIGGDFVGAGDVQWVPGLDAPVSGVVLQAIIANTMVEGLPIREVGLLLLVPLMALAAWVAAERTLRTERVEMPVSTLVGVAAWTIAATTLFLTTRWVVPIVTPVATIAMAGTMAIGIRPLLRPFPNAEV